MEDSIYVLYLNICILLHSWLVNTAASSRTARSIMLTTCSIPPGEQACTSCTHSMIWPELDSKCYSMRLSRVHLALFRASSSPMTHALVEVASSTPHKESTNTQCPMCTIQCQAKQSSHTGNQHQHNVVTLYLILSQSNATSECAS